LYLLGVFGLGVLHEQLGDLPLLEDQHLEDRPELGEGLVDKLIGDFQSDGVVHANQSTLEG